MQRYRTQGLLAVGLGILATGCFSEPDLKTGLRPEGPPEVLAVLLNETPTFCKYVNGVLDEKGPGLVQGSIVCPDEQAMFEPVGASPTGWNMRIMFDELLNGDAVETLEQVSTPPTSPPPRSAARAPGSSAADGRAARPVPSASSPTPRIASSGRAGGIVVTTPTPRPALVSGGPIGRDSSGRAATKDSRAAGTMMRSSTSTTPALTAAAIASASQARRGRRPSVMRSVCTGGEGDAGAMIAVTQNLRRATPGGATDASRTGPGAAQSMRATARASASASSARRRKTST
jgi:hypothetical protein